MVANFDIRDFLGIRLFLYGEQNDATTTLLLHTIILRTFGLIMEIPKVIELDRVRDFCQSENETLQPYEMLLPFAQDPSIPAEWRRAMLQGCVHSLNALKAKIVEGETFTEVTDLDGNKNANAAHALTVIVCEMCKTANSIAPRFSPLVHELLDLCIANNSDIGAKVSITDMAHAVDQFMPWDAALKQRWEGLLSQTPMAYNALVFIVEREPAYLQLEEKAQEQAARLVGLALEERQGVLPTLLHSIYMACNRDYHVIAKIFVQIPEDVYPDLAQALGSDESCRRFLPYIPVRTDGGKVVALRRNLVFQPR